MRAEARAAWLEATAVAANPSSIHGAGQSARRMLEDARERLAAVIDCEPIEVVLTSGGTESTNLALKGLWVARPEGREVVVLPDGEHHATLDTVEWLRTSSGAVVRAVTITPEARIDPDVFGAALGSDVALATAIVANNEVGTVNDAAALSAVADHAGVPLHLDAVAAFGHVPLSFAALRGSGAGGTVAMSLSGHKIGGAPATGALVVSRGARMTALHHGGAAQRDLRAGTQDVAGAVAFAVAAELAAADLADEEARVADLRDVLMAGITAAVPAAEILGDRTSRLGGNVHVHFPGAPGESMLYLLDMAQIAVSTGSACQAGIAEPSHVVRAMGRDERTAREVLRLTLGRTSTRADVDAVLAVIADVYGRAAGKRS